MNKETIKKAAKEHSKKQLGEEQFSKNKIAVKVISEDFIAGVEWAKMQVEKLQFSKK